MEPVSNEKSVKPAFGKLVLIITIVGVFFLTWFALVNPHQEHQRWYDRVSKDLHALTAKRPPDVSREAWEFVICWTLQLHGNCGWRSFVDPAKREPFAAELERRLASPVNMATIDWIWDDYCGLSRLGQSYSNRFRPTHPDNFKHVAIGGGCGIEVP